MKIGNMIGHPIRINGHPFFLMKASGDPRLHIVPMPSGASVRPLDEPASGRTHPAVTPTIDV